MQDSDAMAELEKAAELTESTLAVEGDAFALESTTVAVGGQLISVRGRAGSYSELFLPLFGEHQAHNAALAIAAVESFLGDGSQALVTDVLEEGLASVTSPGRLELIGIEPTVIVDAAHNPHGAASLVAALGKYFAFEEFCVVVSVLHDKDARGIIEALAPVAERFHVTQSQSERAIDYVDLAELVLEVTHEDATYQFDTAEQAIGDARRWADEAPGRAVIVTGSITLVGEAIALARAEGWKK